MGVHHVPSCRYILIALGFRTRKQVHYTRVIFIKLYEYISQNEFQGRKSHVIYPSYHVRVVWKSLLVLYAKDVLTDLVTIHHGQPRWQYCTQVSAMLFGEALSRLFLSSTAPNDRRKISEEVILMYSLKKVLCYQIFQSFMRKVRSLQ